MKEELDVFGYKFPKEAIFRDDGSMSDLGILLTFCIAVSFFRWCGEHPEIVKEFVNERRKICLR